MKAVKPKKNLGQHFLTDLNIAKRIADTVDACPDIPVLEIGPGMGVLTQYLVEKPRLVKAVEIDSESVAYLHENFPQLKDNIIGEDFLRMDLNQIFDGKAVRAHGQLPLRHLLADFLQDARLQGSHSLLHRHDSARSGAAHGIRARQ